MAKITLSAQAKAEIQALFLALFTELESPPPTKEVCAERFADVVSQAIEKADDNT